MPTSPDLSSPSEILTSSREKVEMWLRPQLRYAEYPIKRWYMEVVNWPPTMLGGPADQLGFDIAEGGPAFPEFFRCA